MTAWRDRLVLLQVEEIQTADGRRRHETAPIIYWGQVVALSADRAQAFQQGVGTLVYEVRLHGKVLVGMETTTFRWQNNGNLELRPIQPGTDPDGTGRFTHVVCVRKENE